MAPVPILSEPVLILSEPVLILSEDARRPWALLTGPERRPFGRTP